jgi:type IV pilus assembly protein PilV
MQRDYLKRQSGMTLVEVLISVLVLAIGLLGAAAIQLNALKYTDSSTMTSQASFIAYDMMDRIRANVDGNAVSNGTTDVLSTYAISATAAASAGNLNDARVQDLADFKNNIAAFGGSTAQGSIVIAKPVVTITITWDDSRAVLGNDAVRATNPTSTLRTFTLASRIGVNAVSP